MFRATCIKKVNKKHTKAWFTIYVTRHVASIECALACVLHRVLACSRRVL